MKLLRTLAVMAMAGLLSACALLPGVRDDAQQRSAPFDILGRVLVAYGNKGFTSNLRWQHELERDELWLLTPTGQALAHIVDTPHGATLTSIDQTAYHAGSVESLTRQALGWELPLTRLQYWVRGLPVPEIPAGAAERDSAGRLVKLAQDGWVVNYEYPATTEPEAQPRLVELSNSENRIRLVIDSWRREPAKP